MKPTLDGSWHSAEDRFGPYARVENVVRKSVDAGASDWTRALSPGHFEVEIAATDGDEIWIVCADEMCPSNCVCIWVQTGRQSIAIK